MHSHPGRGIVLLLSGEITVQELDGKETTYRQGQTWIEEVDYVHAGRNSGQETARLVWTILLPEGAPLEVEYKP
jgi:quercetin dioxygenase-like cupin family protein